MGDDARALRLAAVARKWLQDPRVGYSGDLNHAASDDSEREALSSMVIAGVRVSLVEPGRVVCSLRVRAPLTVRVSACPRSLLARAWHLSLWSDLTCAVQDAEGRWHAGAIAAAVDNVCSAVVFTAEGVPTVTVHYSLFYFSDAHPNVRDA
jgi:acyl-coenzyme A thioesterase 13